jgi:hypothetical protein
MYRREYALLATAARFAITLFDGSGIIALFGGIVRWQREQPPKEVTQTAEKEKPSIHAYAPSS